MSNMKQVVDMHRHFNLGQSDHHDRHEVEFRVNFIMEELDEIQSAIRDHDREGLLDGIVDLLVVVYGFADRMGFSEETIHEAFRRVMDANMQKVPAPTAGDSKRGYELDLVKPPEWTPPDLSDLV